MMRTVEFRTPPKSTPPENVARSQKRGSTSVVDGSKQEIVMARNGFVWRMFDGTGNSMKWMKSTKR